MPFPLTLAVFRVRYPQYVDAGGGGAPGDAFVQSKLDEAAEGFDDVIAGAKAEFLHGLLAAHLVEMSPYGRDQRVVVDGRTTTTYKIRFDEIIKVVGGAYRLILDEPESLET